jgi:NhaP-type Na+/H+ or K+/H+ antiporter
VRGQIVVGIVPGYLLVRTWRRLRAREAQVAPAADEVLSPAA